MEYIPGIIHESFQREHYYEMGMDFNIPYYFNVRMIDTEIENTSCIKMKKGDIIIIKYFKPRTAGNAYSFMDGYYRNNKFISMGIETTLSREFVSINSGSLFIDVTNSFERDKKINTILSDL